MSRILDSFILGNYPATLRSVGVSTEVKNNEILKLSICEIYLGIQSPSIF
jgi:hypothetical protein